MRVLRLLIIVLPWVFVGLFSYNYFNSTEKSNDKIVRVNSILERVEVIGKLELIKYNFKEITELTEISKEYWNIFKLGPDSKIALISEGYAVGCIDLTKIEQSDVIEINDTIHMTLPEAELCTFKLDLEKTRIYSLQTNPLKDERSFIQEAYKTAENDIRNSAMSSGILDQTRQNAHLILRPILERLSGKVVVFDEKPMEITLPVSK